MTGLLAVVAVIVLGWFAAGTIWNVRKGRDLMRWMQGGLPILGERTTVRWLGSSAVEMVIRQARRPFAQVTLVIFLEPRDVPWMWAPSRARGRRDTLIIRSRLERAPSLDVEVLDMASWSGRDVQPRIERERWSLREPRDNRDLTFFYKVDDALARGQRLLAIAREGGMSARRISVRREEPHLQLHVDLPAGTSSAAEFFKSVRALAEGAIG